jgi:glutamate/tyrosine decarboxylase-like PLP-dependent enzyme
MAAPRREEVARVLGVLAWDAGRYLDELDERPLRSPQADVRADGFGGALPEDGDGAVAALHELLREGLEASVASTAPRFFHFVQGGVTPAALGADWLTTAIDQNSGMWAATPLGNRLGLVALSWLRELFGLPAGWGGSLTTGATMANFVGLPCARRWWRRRYGVDVDEEGLAGLPPVPVLTSGYIHPSAVEALGMLGIGRGRVRRLVGDQAGRLDLDGLRAALRELGSGAIVVANTSEYFAVRRSRSLTGNSVQLGAGGTARGREG